MDGQKNRQINKQMPLGEGGIKIVEEYNYRTVNDKTVKTEMTVFNV